MRGWAEKWVRTCWGTEAQEFFKDRWYEVMFVVCVLDLYIVTVEREKLMVLERVEKTERAKFMER